MTDSEGTDLPLERTVGAAGGHASEAFGLLANDVRLAILLALWEEYDPHAADNGVPFSRLFEQVDYEDPGNFSYHLQELSGHFIRQHPDGDGYELRTPGLRFIQAIIAGAGVQDAKRKPTEIDHPCPFCEAPTAISYQDGLVVQTCTQCEGVTTEEHIPGYLSAVPFDPAGLAERTNEEIRAASRVAAWRQTQFMADGLCPACSGPVNSWLVCCSDHDSSGICEQCGAKFAALARFSCKICKNHNVSSPKALALFHPTVISFYDDHDISTQFKANDIDSVRQVFDLMDDHEVNIVAGDPARATVTVSVDADEISLTFNETASVVDVTR